jgi:hypothetical protein
MYPADRTAEFPMILTYSLQHVTFWMQNTPPPSQHFT